MKSRVMAVTILSAMLALVSGIAYAETLQGEVTNVDLEGKAIEIQKADAAGAKEAVKVSVNDATTYSGEVTALEEMIEGDAVKLEAEKDAATGNWLAKSVDVSAAE